MTVITISIITVIISRCMYEMCKEMILFLSHKGDDEAIIEESPKDNVEIVNEVAYAEPLTAEEIRWFYKDGVDKRWNEFGGYDSLRIEKIYQERQSLISENNDETNGLPPAEKIVVRGGMYDIEIDNMKCVSLYWPGEYHELLFIYSFAFILLIYYFYLLLLYILLLLSICMPSYTVSTLSSVIIGSINVNKSQHSWHEYVICLDNDSTPV